MSAGRVPVRLGVVGCGAIATLVHLRNACRLDGVSVVAVADPSPGAVARARRLAPGAAAFTTVHDLLGLDLDAVVVAVPSSLHAEVALAVLGARRHLYLEKPLATTLADGVGVVEAAAPAGVVATMGFNRRFHPLVLAARRLLRAGALGEVVSIRTLFSEPGGRHELPGWKLTRATGGGAALDLGSHHVDLLRFLLEVEPQADGGELRSVRSEDDDVALHYRFGRCPATVECSFVRPRGDEIELRDRLGRTLRISRYEGVVTLDGRRAGGQGLRRQRLRSLARRDGDVSYRPALEAFVARVRGSDVALPTLADGLASLRAVVAAEELAVR